MVQDAAAAPGSVIKRTHHTAYAPVKRIFDLTFATAALLLASPVFVLGALLLRRDGGPAFYAQLRIGRGGQPFRCYKFRTMVVDADQALSDCLAACPQRREEWAQWRKLKDDPRVTPLGEFLRRSSLDELPQLWNVIRGDMSLVGPRPIVAEEAAWYGDALALYESVRPGLTGVWQTSGRSDISYPERVAMDAAYVRQRNLWVDLKILAKTVLVVARKTGAY